MNTQEQDPPGWYKKKLVPTPEPSTYGLVFVLLVMTLVIWRRMKEK